MQNQSLDGLQSKVWYRLIKVVFAFLIIGFLLSYNFVIFSPGIVQIDQKQTVIQCNLGIKRKFTLESLPLYLSKKYFDNDKFEYRQYFEGSNNYDITNILDKCYQNTKFGFDIYDIQKESDLLKKANITDYSTLNSEGHVDYESAMTESQKTTFEKDFSDYKEQTKNLSGNSKSKYLDYNFQLFDIVPVFSYVPFLESFFIGNLTILFVSELIKRVFYYVILGKINPV